MNEPTITDGNITEGLCNEVEKDFFNPRTKATARERRRDARYRSKVVLLGKPAKNFDEKYIEKLGRFSMHQLIRRLHQAAREASHFKHLIARSSDYAGRRYKPLQDFALICFTRIQTEIEFRTKPSEEV